MSHNVGQMFYYGEVPWHGLGTELDSPATLEEAIREGGLDWAVRKVPLMTNEDPPSATSSRKAVVRDDIPPGGEGRVLGVVHPDFCPLQNKKGLEMFDKLMGEAAKYHTGGYLGNGERIWLLARLPKEMYVSTQDRVDPYILFSNSHDGTLAVDVRLTTVRVVCQNTLHLALSDDRTKRIFKRAHDGMWGIMEHDMQAFLNRWTRDVREYERTFRSLADTECDDSIFDELTAAVLPMPPEPATGAGERAEKAYQTRVQTVERERTRIRQVWQHGVNDGHLFPEVPKEERTLWGALNAVTAGVDHLLANEKKRDPFYYSVFGRGNSLKNHAWDWVRSKNEGNPKRG